MESDHALTAMTAPHVVSSKTIARPAGATVTIVRFVLHGRNVLSVLALTAQTVRPAVTAKMLVPHVVIASIALLAVTIAAIDRNAATHPSIPTSRTNRLSHRMTMSFLSAWKPRPR